MKDTHNSSTERITTQQQAIYALLNKVQDHVTAEHVYQAISKNLPRISRATVYRNLDKLTYQNLINKVTIQGVYYFEAKSEPHYHVVCLSCHRIDNLGSQPATDIEEFFSRSTKYKLTGHDLVLYGLCPACQSRR